MPGILDGKESKLLPGYIQGLRTAWDTRDLVSDKKKKNGKMANLILDVFNYNPCPTLRAFAGQHRGRSVLSISSWHTVLALDH